MADKTTDEVAYRDRALEAIKAAEDNLGYGHFETAVSRAYYACFYAVHSKLAAMNLIASSHKQTGILFRKHFILTGKMEKQYSRVWEALQKYRMDADYAPIPSIQPERAKTLIEDSRKFVEKILGENP